MKTEYQSTITIIEEILAAIEGLPDNWVERGKVTNEMTNRLFNHMLEVFPDPQPYYDTTDIELRDKELDLVRVIQSSGPSDYDILNPPDDFLPQLYIILVMRALIKYHNVPIDSSGIKDFGRFWKRHGSLIKRVAYPYDWKN
jgi:hypothetical protein